MSTKRLVGIYSFVKIVPDGFDGFVCGRHVPLLRQGFSSHISIGTQLPLAKRYHTNLKYKTDNRRILRAHLFLRFETYLGHK